MLWTKNFKWNVGNLGWIIAAFLTISASAVDEEALVIDRAEINENDNATTTFYNPSQLENKPGDKMIKCDKCDYKARQNI